MIDLQTAKDFLRVDGDDENTIIQAMITAAEDYLRNAGVKNTSSELYKIVVLMLTSIFYEHRDTADKQIAIPPIINNFITQLSLSGEGGGRNEPDE